jgi:hypothetical protein
MVGGVRHRAGRLVAWIGLFGTALALPAPRADAQDRVTLEADLLFYGDNTEFRNPFREGETIFGAAGWLSAAVDVNDRVTVSLGVFGSQRFGSSEAFERVRPVATLAVKSRGSSFFFGTLPSRDRAMTAPAAGTGPHGLLPPIQRETLIFDRPYEAGLQWTFRRRHLTHEAWLAWQRLNTPAHRERLDAGVNAALTLSRRLALPLQLHIVHEGGQQFSTGPVADSVAGAAGVRIGGPPEAPVFSAVELYGLVSRYVPDREDGERSRDGRAFLGRASAGRAGWTAHVLFWRGDGFVKDEGDANYLSLRRDGRYYRGTRDYAEAGLMRTFHPAPGVSLGVAGRFHRVEANYEYSYRIVGAVRLGWRVRQASGTPGSQ